MKAIRAEFIDRMSDFATLLNDPDYFAAFRTVQEYNMGADEKRPTKMQNDAAMAAMTRIAKQKGLVGLHEE